MLIEIETKKLLDLIKSGKVMLQTQDPAMMQVVQILLNHIDEQLATNRQNVAESETL